MSNKLKKDLSNAKARLKAAQKKLSKIETSEDNQAIAEAQSKVDLEEEIIDDLEQRIQNETDNVVAIVREENGSLTNVIEDAKSIKEVINLLPLNNKSNTSKKRDLPQVSFRTEDVIYQKLKQHVKHPESNHLSTFDSLADMSRRLNLSDLNGSIYFILKRTNQQLARFLDVAKADKSELQANQKLMLRNAFINFHADTDADKIKLIEHLENLHQFIETLNLYSFED